MKELKCYLKYIKGSGLILPTSIILIILILAILQGIYSMAVLASAMLLVILIFSIKDYRYKKNNNYICYKLRK